MKTGWTGVGLMVASIVVMCCLLFPALFPVFLSSSPEKVTVVALSDHQIPTNDYRFLFSRMGLSFSVLYASEGDKNLVEKAMEELLVEKECDKVILMATGKTADIALRIARDSDFVVGTVLVSPIVEDFSQRSSSDFVSSAFIPGTPVGIFATAGDGAVPLFEFLSGEEATLWAGQEKEGLLPRTTFLSASGLQSLTVWNSLSDSSPLQVFMAFLPSVQLEITAFISLFVLPVEGVLTGYENHVFFMHSFRLLGVVFFLAGLVLSISSLKRWRRVQPVLTSRHGDKNVFTTAINIASTRKKRILVLGATTILLVSILIALFLRDYIALWIMTIPVLLLLLTSLAFLSRLSMRTKVSRLSHGRRTYLLVFSLLFPLGIGLMRLAGLLTIRLFVSENRYWMYLGFFLLFYTVRFILTTSQLCVKAIGDGVVSSSKVFGGRIDHALYLASFVTFPVLGWILSDMEMLVTGLIVYVLFLLSLWTENLFRSVTGSAWYAALMSAMIFFVSVF